MKTTSLFVPLATAAFVSAHGFVMTLTVDGTPYDGNTPGFDHHQNKSVIRAISTNFPVKGATNPSITCGQNSRKAVDTAQANPGDVLTFQWMATADETVRFFFFFHLCAFFSFLPVPNQCPFQVAT